MIPSRSLAVLGLWCVIASGCRDDSSIDEHASDSTMGETSSSAPTTDVSSTTMLDSDASTSTTEDGGEAKVCAAVDDALTTLAMQYGEQHALVGLSIGASYAQCEPRRFTWGSASLDPADPLAEDHVLRAGSVTKIFTSVLMLKLAEADLLELEDTLDTFGFEFTHASEISIRQLLDHTSGLADYQNDPGFRSANQVDPKRVWTPQELVDHALALGPVATPGQLHAYSNTNYVLAAMIAEQVTGDSFSAALRMRVLEPAGLAHTYVEGEESWNEPTAIGYLVVGDTSPLDTTDLYHASQVWSSGALVSTVDDLRGWLHTLLSTDFLLPESQQALVEMVPTMQPGITHYGLGLFVVEAGDVTAYGHNGAVMGFQATVLHHAPTDTTVAIMQNTLALTEGGTLVMDPTTLAIEILAAIDEILAAR
jgi:D-alanyl-D-alanine carboxypeptidase